MRYLALAVIFASLPLLISLLRSFPQRRHWAFAAIALLLFFGDSLNISGQIIAWPMWSGVSRGIAVSPIDSLALSLILTRRSPPDRLPFWGFIACFSATQFISLLSSTVPMATLFLCAQTGRAALLFAAVGGECHRPAMRNGLLAGLAMGLLLEAGYVVEQKSAGMIQATGTMFHQNSLGMMTELALIPLLAALLGGDRRKLILAGVGAGMIVITGGGSRGALGFAAGGCAILLVLSFMRGMTPAKTRVFGLAALGAVIATPLAVMTLKDRFGSRSVTELDDQRAKFELAARAMAADHPFGVGGNMYVTTANTKGYADNAGVAWNFANRSASVHNAYLLARAETGWLGEGALILLLTMPLLSGVRLAFARRQEVNGEIALGSAVALGVIIIHNNYEYAQFVYTVMSLVFMNIGLIAAQVRLARLQRKGRPAPQRAPVRRPAPDLAYAGRQPR